MRDRSKLAAGGFTLIELMIAITIIGILLMIALPTFRDSLNRNRIASASNDFITALNVARNEAITRTIPVSVCPTANGTSCTGGGAATDWAKGWMVFTDQSTAGSVDGTDVVLRVWGPIASALGDTVTPTATTLYIQFAADGTTNLTAASTGFKFRPASCASNQQRSVTLGSFGRSSVKTEACS